MFTAYQYSLLGLWLILVTIVIQAMVAVRVHRRQEGGYMPGMLKASLDHSSIVFRTHRTYQNSLENIVPLLGMAFIGMLCGYGALKLSIIIWVYAVARILHMVLYYKIATKKKSKS